MKSVTIFERIKRMKTTAQLPRVMAGLAMALTLQSSWSHADFISPTDRVPFRRDQLPIDVETMRQLSRQLTTLCTSLKADRPEDQRVAAQFLAVAEALDPVNRQASELLEQLISKQALQAAGDAELTHAKARAWRTQAWLASDEAGKDGQVLAQCLGDVLARVDASHPAAATHKSDLGKWNGWVAPLDDFAKPQPTDLAANNDEEELPEMADDSKDQEDEDGDEAEENEVEFAVKSGAITTPLWLYNEKTEAYALKLATVSMNSSIDKNNKAFRYHVNGSDENMIRGILLAINNATVPQLKEIYHGVPEGGVVSMGFSKNEYYSISRNGENLSAAAMVLAATAMSGAETTGVVIGIVKEDGKLALPRNSWEMIRMLSTAPPSRIILPKAIEDVLPALLSLDDLQFLMKHDIFLADTAEELIALTKKTPDSAVASSLANFADIRSKATSTIGPFVANPHVSKRLESIVAATPNYASAQLLLMQARGKRPVQLTEKMLAHEIRKALQPLAEINARAATNGDKGKVTSAEVQAAHDSSRAALDPLERIVASSNREFYGEALDLANRARTLARAMDKVGGKGFLFDERGFHDKSLAESSKDIQNGLPLIDRKISLILGEPLARKEKNNRGFRED
ncbi:MAG: hypothetical protein B9S37_01960 [Verrucomicrobiia bacterium Tous-C3TDCM]|nr:MAG: hypothetical protein B9S37_01960 [Verrucomicrobiae bacterium Tous-C3TDCM]